MKFLIACFWDSILFKFYIVLLKLVSIWLEITFYIWYQSVMIVLDIELLLCIIIITSLWIKKLHPNAQVTLIDYYYYLPKLFGRWYNDLLENRQKRGGNFHFGLKGGIGLNPIPRVKKRAESGWPLRVANRGGAGSPPGSQGRVRGGSGWSGSYGRTT